MATSLAESNACYQGAMEMDVGVIADLERGCRSTMVVFDPDGKPRNEEVSLLCEAQ